MSITLREFCACVVVVFSILSSILGCAGGGDARTTRALDIQDPAPPLMLSTNARQDVAAVAAQPRVTQVANVQPALVAAAAPAARDLRVMSFNIRRSIFIDAHNH